MTSLGATIGLIVLTGIMPFRKLSTSVRQVDQGFVVPGVSS